jgi:membrane-anchored glycerophosphoryl diester phosphodiesterase (GDPDase)
MVFADFFHPTILFILLYLVIIIYVFYSEYRFLLSAVAGQLTLSYNNGTLHFDEIRRCGMTRNPGQTDITDDLRL